MMPPPIDPSRDLLCSTKIGTTSGDLSSVVASGLSPRKREAKLNCNADHIKNISYFSFF
jgi:hypothetical protein